VPPIIILWAWWSAWRIIQHYRNVWGRQAIYRPTVHYAYCPCDCAIASLYELRGYNYNLQPQIRIMTDEIISGADILGALVMGHPYRSWWCGSDLDIESRVAWCRIRTPLPYRWPSPLLLPALDAREPSRGVHCDDSRLCVDISKPTWKVHLHA
jgi:hypothetical protein